jgi:CHAT domain-containing protein
VVLAERAAAEALRPLTRGESWARLPGTRREVEAIAALFPDKDATALLGERATESAMQGLAAKRELKRYRYLHYATHGQANDTLAMESALILAPDAERSSDLSTVLESDGRITAQQIVNTWDLDADLVVLSACESALGKRVAGEGCLGFTQALFVKGARSVVLSLWKVDDQATALLMTRFYRNLLGKREGLLAPLPKADALAEAKSWLRGLSAAEAETAAESRERGERVRLPGKPVEANSRPYEHPRYWAAFILVGDPG